jgi:hypothetical protein
MAVFSSTLVSPGLPSSTLSALFSFSKRAPDSDSSFSTFAISTLALATSA